MATPKETTTRPRKVGVCRVLGELGRGGMATVYRGVHEPLQREVAIKELHPASLKDAEALSRFRREAIALAAFRHQNIVTLYDLIEKNDALFMIMEFVNGPTLSELIREGPLPADVTAVIAGRLASALDHAHFNRIIHRDLKPSNVMITKAGEVKLMDFGIAKDEGLEALTQQGVAIGTPSYMSPEQVTGGTMDHRTDLFSLGVVMYECLTGQKPFVGQTAGEVFSRIRDGRHKPLQKSVPGLPPPLVRVVRRAMRTKISDRYQDAAGMRRDLELYLARNVKMSHQALLVAYLKHKNRITETEALARLTRMELSAIERFDREPRRRKSRARWLLAAAAAGGGTALFMTQHHWLPLVERLGR